MLYEREYGLGFNPSRYYEVRYSSSDDEFDGEVEWMDNEEMAYLGNQFDSTYSGKESYFNQEGEVVLEKGMIFPDA